jgi:DNA polymerase-3 subunit gamma/tau
MSYTVLARRYRSETFDDVVGQEAVSQTLKNAIESDRVAHAYLFSGTRGVGKTTMARILAKALNCLAADKPTTTPCCKCESCIAVSEGEDIDVLEIDGASNTGVDHIRELRQNAIYRPARARFKVYIIDEVHMLSTGAFNALLKTLEEPPEFVKFILATTEPNKVLPTILSRCQRFDFRNIQVEDIVGHLKAILTAEGVEAEDTLVRRIARLGRGSMRDALSLLDQIISMSDDKLTLGLLEELLGTPRSEIIVELTQAISQNDLSQGLLQIDKALGEGLALEQLAQAMQEHFRDLLVMRNCGEQTELVDISDKAVREQMAEQAKMFDDATLIYNITVMEELRRAIKSSGSNRALLEAAVVRLAASDRFSDTKVLLEQLQQLQSTPTTTPTTSPTNLNRSVNTTATKSSPQPVAKTATTVRNSSTTGQPAAQATTTAQATTAAKPQAVNELVPPETLTLEYIRKHWQRIVEQLSQHNQSHLVALKFSNPEDFRDGVLTLGYDSKQNGMRSYLESRPDQIAEIGETMTGLLHQPIRLSLAQIDKPADQSAEKPASTTANPVDSEAPRVKMPPGAKPSQQEINDAMNEPHVRNVQRILGGKVRHIERLKEK